MHTISASLRMKQPHDQLKEFGVVLEFVGEATKASFLERAGTASQSQPLALDITSFCIAEMVRHYMDLNKQEICATGEIVPEDIDDSEVEGLFQTLRSHSGGAMVLNPEFSMLMFPTGQQTWDFWRLPKAGPGVKLQFVIMPHIQPLPKAKEPSYMTNAQPEQAPSSEIVLDHDRRFHANSRDRFVFLLFHPNYAEEIEALMTSLHKAGATVYLNNESGSWVQFTTKCDSGTIIVSFRKGSNVLPIQLLIYRCTHLLTTSIESRIWLVSLISHLSSSLILARSLLLMQLRLSISAASLSLGCFLMARLSLSWTLYVLVRTE